MVTDKRFPVMGVRSIMPNEIVSISWAQAEVVYKEYIRKFGDKQTLERIAERGGFYFEEIVGLLTKVP